jgi:hypothetical protein
VNRIIISALILLVGSSALAAEPTSFFAAAKNAERTKDYRRAVYYLTGIALGQADNKSNGLKKKAILKKLILVYQEANQSDRARELQTLDPRICKTFLEKEHINTNPIYSISEYSDGTLAIYGRGQSNEEDKLLNPKPHLLAPSGGHWELPTIIRPTDSNYNETLKSYWWYHLPNKAQLETKRPFIPAEHIGPSPMGSPLDNESK